MKKIIISAFLFSAFNCVAIAPLPVKRSIRRCPQCQQEYIGLHQCLQPWPTAPKENDGEQCDQKQLQRVSALIAALKIVE